MIYNIHLYIGFILIISESSIGQNVGFVGDCTCPEAYDLPICCDPSFGNTEQEEPEDFLVDYANPCLAECNGIPPPAQESEFCRLSTCEQLLEISPDPVFLNPPQTESDDETESDDDTISDEDIPTEFIDDCECNDEVISPICCIVEDETGMKENFDNTCLADCNGLIYPYFATQGGKCEVGTCESLHPCGCSPDYDPICCNNVMDFMTICDAECGGIQNPSDECESGRCFGIEDVGGGIELGDSSEDQAYECVSACDGYGAEGTGQEVCCDGDKDFMSSCYAVCYGYDANDDCVDGVCQPPIEGLFSIGTPQEYTMLNMITIGIQVFILGICCLGIGCAIPSLVEDGKWGFEFNKMKSMPNFDFKMKMPKKHVSYGPDL